MGRGRQHRCCKRAERWLLLTAGGRNEHKIAIACVDELQQLLLKPCMVAAGGRKIKSSLALRIHLREEDELICPCLLGEPLPELLGGLKAQGDDSPSG